MIAHEWVPFLRDIAIIVYVAVSIWKKIEDTLTVRDDRRRKNIPAAVAPPVEPPPKKTLLGVRERYKPWWMR